MGLCLSTILPDTYVRFNDDDLTFINVKKITEFLKSSNVDIINIQEEDHFNKIKNKMVAHWKKTADPVYSPQMGYTSACLY